MSLRTIIGFVAKYLDYLEPLASSLFHKEYSRWADVFP
jgi:hypothetical protein